MGVWDLRSNQKCKIKTMKHHKIEPGRVDAFRQDYHTLGILCQSTGRDALWCLFIKHPRLLYQKNIFNKLSKKPYVNKQNEKGFQKRRVYGTLKALFI